MKAWPIHVKMVMQMMDVMIFRMSVIEVRQANAMIGESDMD